MPAHNRRLLDPATFSQEARLGRERDAAIFTVRTASATSTDVAARQVSYVLSTSAVARDGHTIATAGWQLADYRSNPVFLFAHDASEPPIGRMVALSIVGDELRGTVEYAPPEIYPFADTIFRLVKGGYLNAVSVSWEPLAWSYAKGTGRAPGAIDFSRQALLEVSQVPVPSLTGALVTARAAGIDTRSVFEWAARRAGGSQTRSGRTRAPSLIDLAKTDTREDRRKLARFVAYENCRRLGADVPASSLPPQTRHEREAILAGARIRAAASAR